MIEEWLAYLRDNAPELYEQALRSIKSSTPWHDQRIVELEAEVARLQALHLERTKLTTRVIEERDAAEAKLAAVRKELEYAVSASIEGNDVDVVAEDFIRDALDGLLKRTILYNDPCAGSYEVLDPPTTDELEALLREDGK